MKIYWGNEGISPHILILGFRCRWVVSFTPWVIYPQWRNTRYSLDMRLAGCEEVQVQLPRILIDSTRWKWVLSFTIRPFYPRHTLDKRVGRSVWWLREKVLSLLFFLSWIQVVQHLAYWLSYTGPHYRQCRVTFQLVGHNKRRNALTVPGMRGAGQFTENLCTTQISLKGYIQLSNHDLNPGPET